MGNLIHPLSFRLGITKFWNSNWALSSRSNSSYSYLSIKNMLLLKYFDKLLNALTRRHLKLELIFSNIKIINVYSKVTIILYFRFNKLRPLLVSLRKMIRRYLHKNIKNFSFLVKQRRRYKYRKNIDFSKELLALKNSALSMHINKADVFAHQLSSVFKYHKMKNKKLTVKKNYRKRALPFLITKYFVYKKVFKHIKTFLTSSLKRFWDSSVVSPNITFAIYDLSGISAFMLARYVVIKLQQRFPVRGIVNNLLKQMRFLQRTGKVLGFKITCTGRFARRGRASYIWKNAGKVGASTLDLDVDYALLLVTLTNSICGIKVWITRSKQTSKMLYI